MEPVYRPLLPVHSKSAYLAYHNTHVIGTMRVDINMHAFLLENERAVFRPTANGAPLLPSEQMNFTALWTDGITEAVLRMYLMAIDQSWSEVLAVVGCANENPELYSVFDGSQGPVLVHTRQVLCAGRYSQT